ncbi:MAG: VOC family protein [Elusimicrobia bacterium]|nr:VOC family protein [Elusimicrobiota bacterium]
MAKTAKKGAKGRRPLIAGLDHVFLPTARFEKAWEFWTGAAGAEAVAQWGGGSHQAGHVRFGGVDLVVTQEDEDAEQPELGYPIEHGRPVLFFATPDLDALRRALSGAGARVLRGPLTTHWGRRAMTVKAGELVLAFVEKKPKTKGK